MGLPIILLFSILSGILWILVGFVSAIINHVHPTTRFSYTDSCVIHSDSRRCVLMKALFGFFTLLVMIFSFLYNWADRLQFKEKDWWEGEAFK